MSKNKENPADSISITWHIEDVLQQAADMEVEITDDQARTVLRWTKEYHDATVGVNWDVIESYISQLADASGDVV